MVTCVLEPADDIVDLVLCVRPHRIQDLARAFFSPSLQRSGEGKDEADVH